jgi:hypothetical protein
LAKTDTKQLSRRVLVVVKRDLTDSIPVVAWEHELPLLESIHGEENISRPDPSTLDDGYKAKPSAAMLVYNKTQEVVPRPSENLGLGFVFVGDPRAEYSRLEGRYGRSAENEKVSVVEYVYGRFQENRFAPLLGQPTLEDLPEGQLRQMIRDAGIFQPARFEDSKEVKDAASKQAADFIAFTKAQLVKLAAEAGLEVT